MSNVYDALNKAERTNAPMASLSFSWPGISVESKTTILLFSLLTFVIVSYLMGRALRTQIHARAAVMAINLSDAAAGYLVTRDILRMKTMVVKYGRLDGVAYAMIRDRDGKEIANSLNKFSAPISQVSDPRLRVNHQKLTLEGKTVYETREPILEGQLGTAHVGIWGDAVEREIRQVLFTFLWPLTFLLLATLTSAALLARRFVPSFWRRMQVSRRMGRARPARSISQGRF